MIIVILQARYNSTRLQGKVLKSIIGKPMLQLQIERIRQSKKADQIVVATSIEKSDDPIRIMCDQLKIPCYRGDLENVLERYYQTALLYNPDHIVRATGDCPLTDPELMDKIIQFYLENEYEYVSNVLEPTFPDGLDVEILSMKTLDRLWQSAKLPSQLEHVTSMITDQPEKFKIGHYKGLKDYSDLRWTVDEPEDFEFVCTVYEHLYHQNPNFGMDEILDLLEKRPELMSINSHLNRNEGLIISQQKDDAFKREMS